MPDNGQPSSSRSAIRKAAGIMLTWLVYTACFGVLSVALWLCTRDHWPFYVAALAILGQCLLLGSAYRWMGAKNSFYLVVILLLAMIIFVVISALRLIHIPDRPDVNYAVDFAFATCIVLMGIMGGHARWRGRQQGKQ